MAIPELYRYGREGTFFGLGMFSWYMLDAVVQVSNRLPIPILGAEQLSERNCILLYHVLIRAHNVKKRWLRDCHV